MFVDGRILAMGSVAALAALGVLGHGSANSDPSDLVIGQIMDLYFPGDSAMVPYVRRILDLEEGSVDRMWIEAYRRPAGGITKEEKIADLLSLNFPAGGKSTSYILRLMKVGALPDGENLLKNLLNALKSDQPSRPPRTPSPRRPRRARA